jgi:plastocyanin
MKGLLFAIAVAALLATPQSPATGTVKGRVRLSGVPPGNPIIRMGVDPRCAAISRGKRIVQETVVTTEDGGLANVFVHLNGSFPQSPPPSGVVSIDQRSCIFVPRVIGARVGQTIEFRNSDNTLHDIHSFSTKGSVFNVGQPIAGMVYRIQFTTPEVMVHIKCDVHRWMNTYIGVVDHPYFTVTSGDGTFTIGRVPPGVYTIQAWHEQYGPVTQNIIVNAGDNPIADFTYTGLEKPGR